MLGAIAGDIIGSVYEWKNVKSKEFPLFQSKSKYTDDSVMTLAIAEAIVSGRSYLDAVRDLGRRYPHAGYGGSFRKWLQGDDTRPYGSWGNGSAMRVSPVGWAFSSKDEVLVQAERTAAITHDHPEGIKGAKATALAVFLARQEYSKAFIKEEIETAFGYDLGRTLDEIRPTYVFDVSCQGSVPQAITAFLESIDYEDAIRNAISLGGDSDTIACIAGGIAEAFYGEIPIALLYEVKKRLPSELWAIVQAFTSKFRPALALP